VLQCHAPDCGFNSRGRRPQNAKIDAFRPTDGKSLLIKCAVFDEKDAAPSPRPYFIEPELA